MEKIILICILILLVINIVICLVTCSKKKNLDISEKNDINELFKKDLKENNDILIQINQLKFNELNSKLDNFKEEFNKISIILKDMKFEINKSITDEFKSINKLISDNNINNINQIKIFLDSYKEEISKRLDKVDITIKESLERIQKDNNQKLDEVRQTVNEKLEHTLEERLNKSFENVFKQINELNKTIGQIESLASNVSSLKNVFANVKTKGIVGEVILSNIISELLSKDNYLENVITKKGSKDRVEFAIKIPTGDNHDLLLPIDSKFPTESYNKILLAIESSDKTLIEEARKELAARIKQEASDIKNKYIDEPNTTSFGIMFLPIEGLYAEVINMNLFEELNNKYNVIVCGPSTFSALLNALQMGFKSLIIQKKSAEVFSLLQSVKTEFNRFAEQLEKTQTKYEQASKELDDLVGVRTRQMQRKLDKVETINLIEDNKHDL